MTINQMTHRPQGGRWWWWWWGCLFNYCQPLRCTDTELHQSTSTGLRLPTGMHSMQLPCCMQCTIHVMWLDAAWQVCMGRQQQPLWLLQQCHWSRATWGCTYRQPYSTIAYTHPPPPPQCWDALPSLVQRCGGYLWPINHLKCRVSQLVIAWPH